MEWAAGPSQEWIQPIIQEDSVKSKMDLLDWYHSIANLISRQADKYKTDPKSLLIDAAKENKELGSSTCVMALLDEKKPVLYTANLGDSGYMLLRKQGQDLVS